MRDLRLFDINKTKQLKRLWKEVFEDKDEVIEAFFALIYKPENTLTHSENGEIVSALHLIESTINILGKKYKAFYIYAAATLPEHRGRGLMGELLKEARSFALENKADFLFLYPSQASLYDYYARHGYEKWFMAKTVTLSSVSARTLSGNGYEIKALDAKSYSQIRNGALKNTDAVIWGENILDFQLKLLEAYKGIAYSAYKNAEPAACLLFEDNGERIETIEALSVNGDIEPLAAILAEKLECEQYSLKLPVNFRFSADNMSVSDAGMALPLTDEAKILKERINTLYMGINLG